MSDSDLLQFAPFSSALDAGFWYKLSQKKLDELRLEQKPVAICGFFTNSSGNSEESLPPVACIDYTSFDEDLQLPPKSFPLKGLLYNKNTLEEFKKEDKKEFIQNAGQEIWDIMKSEAVLDDPSSIHRLLCLTFADLKKYHYYYWVAFPAFLYPKVIHCKKNEFSEYFDNEQANVLLSGYHELTVSHKMGFLAHIYEDGIVSVFPLKHYDSIKDKPGKLLLGFSDPSRLDGHPGWPLRNLLTLVAVKWGKEKTTWDVLCLRETFKAGVQTCSNSLVLTVQLCDIDLPEGSPVTVGWEKNRNKLVPRMVNMSWSMDSKKLAESSVDLNLKLMRWRLAPDLNLDVIKSTKCLLVGAGTLGCNVARCLLGWGVRKITFIDNSNVSYSNPVRQTLFEFKDSVESTNKATAAAEALKRIYPGVEAEGKVLSIPMPGHALMEKSIEATQKEVTELEGLVESHDVIFLLTDTRESRWLPTVIGCAKKKIVITTALGFDTFLVMRHGFVDETSSASRDDAIMSEKPWRIIPGQYLGCYFCNDVVAPGNSTQDRTLDQQCTVTRPGVSYIAAATAVELVVSILQHPERAGAAATLEFKNDHQNTVLGMVPHQIRGYLDRFQNMIHASKAFDRCIACSSKIVAKYKADGFGFLLQAFNDPDTLADLTGLTDLLKNINEEDVLELSDDDSV